MNQNNNSNKTIKDSRKYLYLLVIFIIISVFYLMINSFYHAKIDDYKRIKIGEMQISYDTIMHSYLRYTQIIYNEIINQPEIWMIMEGANSDKQETVDNARQQLLDKLNPLYARLKKFKIRQLHFHHPDNRSFLRFHRPGKYGDDLTNIRFSIKQTNIDLKPHVGFEEGRIFNGFRYVFPIITDDEKHLGSVEISSSFEAIKEEMQKVFKKKYYFIIDKDVVDEKIFSSEKSNYIESDLHDGFVLEKYVDIPDDIKAINKDIRKKTRKPLNAYLPLVLESSFDNSKYIVSLFPISNVKGDKVGYIISYEEDKTLNEIHTIFLIIMISLLVFVLVFSNFFFKLRKSNKLLLASTKDLVETKERLSILNKIIRHDLANDFVVINSAMKIYKKTDNSAILNEIDKTVLRSLKTIEDYKKYQVLIESNQDIYIVHLSHLLNEIILDYPDINFDIVGDCSVYGDDALYSVFKNLINNSIKHGEASEIQLKISSKKSICEIRYQDNGSGISPDIQDNIFEEGFSSGKTGNTGIGLFIVKQTIERLGGTIILEGKSTPGVQFIIHLRSVIADK